MICAKWRMICRIQRHCGNHSIMQSKALQIMTLKSSNHGVRQIMQALLANHYQKNVPSKRTRAMRSFERDEETPRYHSI